LSFENCKLQRKTTKKHVRHKKNASIPFNQQNPHKKFKKKKTLKKVKTET
jgi:hypothetical protein